MAKRRNKTGSHVFPAGVPHARSPREKQLGTAGHFPLSYAQLDSLLPNATKDSLEQDLYFGLSPALTFFSLTSDQTFPYFESKCPLLWRISGTSPSLTECISPLPLRMPHRQPVSLCVLGFVFVFSVFWTLGDGVHDFNYHFHSIANKVSVMGIRYVVSVL